MSKEFVGVVFQWEDVILRPHGVVADAHSYREIVGAATVHDDARALLPSLRYRGYRSTVISLAPFHPDDIAAHADELGLASYIDGFLSLWPDLQFSALSSLLSRVPGPAEGWVLLASARHLLTAATEAGMPAYRIARREPGPADWTTVAAVNGILGERFRPRD